MHKKSKRDFEYFGSLRSFQGMEKKEGEGVVDGMKGREPRPKTYMSSTWKFCSGFKEDLIFTF